MTAKAGVLAVVVARAGSKGLPGKNAIDLHGHPMICRTIEHARDAETVDRIVVSTDGKKIAEAARSMNVEVVNRPAVLANDTAPVDAAVRHAVDQIGAAEQIIVILYANVPVRPDGLIDRAVRMLMETGADSVQSYTDVGKHHPYWMVSLDADDRVKPYRANAVYRRQDLPKLLIPDGGVIAVRRGSLFTVADDDAGAFLGTHRRGIRSPAGSVIDVDTAVDLAMAEAMLACGGDASGAGRQTRGLAAAAKQTVGPPPPASP